MIATNDQIIYWTSFVHNKWRFYMAATEQGLCYVGSPNKLYAELSNWAMKRLPGFILVEDESKLEQYTTELKEYLNGDRNQFTLSVDLKGTPFQLKTWDALTKVPYGETHSYTQIAELIKSPMSVRAVGAAIGANPVLIVIPCHRVIAKSGALTGFRAGMEMKKRLLHLESKIKAI